jgi:hypothetical protein
MRCCVSDADTTWFLCQHSLSHDFCVGRWTTPTLFKAAHVEAQRIALRSQICARRSAQHRPDKLVAGTRLFVQAVAYAAAEGRCCGSATADALIVAGVKAKFKQVAVCKVTVEAETVGHAVAQAIASGLAISVRMSSMLALAPFLLQ